MTGAVNYREQANVLIEELGAKSDQLRKAFIGKDAAPLPPAHKAFWVI